LQLYVILTGNAKEAYYGQEEQLPTHILRNLLLSVRLISPLLGQAAKTAAHPLFLNLVHPVFVYIPPTKQPIHVVRWANLIGWDCGLLTFRAFFLLVAFRAAILKMIITSARLRWEKVGERYKGKEMVKKGILCL